MRTGYPIKSDKGFTILESLVAFSITIAVSVGVFMGIGRFLLLTAQDEIYHQLRNDLLLTMDEIKRDIHLATNVVPKAGPRETSATTLVLRSPVTNLAGEVQPEQFHFITYTVFIPSEGTMGLIRETWASEDATEPQEEKVLNDSIVGLGFLYGGKNIAQVTNLIAIRDIEIILISGRKTGLPLIESGMLSPEGFADLTILNDLLDYGLDFPSLRDFIDEMNGQQMDVAITASMGAATMRNRRSLGLIEPAAPVGL